MTIFNNTLAIPNARGSMACMAKIKRTYRLSEITVKKIARLLSKRYAATATAVVERAILESNGGKK